MGLESGCTDGMRVNKITIAHNSVHTGTRSRALSSRPYSAEYRDLDLEIINQG
jgi:hypothetical protein